MRRRRRERGRAVHPKDLGFGRLFEKIRDGVIVADAKSQRIVLWNSAATAIFGYSPAEALELRVEDLVPERYKARHRAGIARYHQTGRGRFIDANKPLDLPAVAKGGKETRVELSLSPLDPLDPVDGGAAAEDKGVPEEEEAGRFVLAIVRDVNERKRADEEIQRLNETLERQVMERTAALAAREKELKELLGKLVEAQEEERRRVAREVHDGLAQVAVAAHQHLQVFADEHPPGSELGPGELDRALELAQRTVKEARRVIEGLRPTALDDFGLAVALRQWVEEFEKNEDLNISYEEALGEEDKRLPPQAETALYRVAQEALTNAKKHAQTAKAYVTLDRLGPRKVRLEVRDEGRGFTPSSETLKDGAAKGLGQRVGIVGMKERIALLGGELEIFSEPGRGTSVVAEVPLANSSSFDQRDLEETERSPHAR